MADNRLDTDTPSSAEIGNQTIHGGHQQFADDIINQTVTDSTVHSSVAAKEIKDSFNTYYGVPQKVVDRLEELLQLKDVKLQERESVIASWIQKYNELESQLANRTDDIAKQAKVFLDEGKLEDAEQLFKQSLANKLNIVKEAAAEAFSLAKIKVLQLNYPEAETYYRKAVQLDPENALYLNDLAVHFYTLGKYADAELLYQRSLVIREHTLGKDHPAVATSLNNLAELYRTQGKYADSESLYQRSLAIREHALGKDHPDVAQSLNNLAGLYDTQGKYADAEPLYQRSLVIKEHALGKDHPYVATSLTNLAGLYYDQGRYAAAEPLFQRSLVIWEHALGKDHPYVAISLNNLALLYYNQCKYADAELLFQRSLAIYERALGKDHPNTKTIRENLEILQAEKH